MGIRSVQRSLRVLAKLQGTLHCSARAEHAQALRLLTTAAAQDDHSSWMRFLANSAFAGLLVGSAAAWACNPRQAHCEQAQQASAGQTQVLALTSLFSWTANRRQSKAGSLVALCCATASMSEG